MRSSLYEIAQSTSNNAPCFSFEAVNPKYSHTRLRWVSNALPTTSFNALPFSLSFLISVSAVSKLSL